MPLSRRDLLKLGVLGTAAMALPVERVARTKSALKDRIPSSKLPKPFTVPFTTAPVLAPYRSDGTNDYYWLQMRAAQAEILPGLKTTIWGYNGITPGPTIVCTQGRPAVVRQHNALPAVHPTLLYEPITSVHLHGSASLPCYDGYASDVTKPGQYKDYKYPNFQNARTLWYHDHGVHHTKTNAYMGLAGQYILVDPKERALPLPKGRYDIPLTIRDAVFSSKGDLLWDSEEDKSMEGDVILVNGRPWPAMKVERRKYRFRMLNGSISRGLQLKLSDNSPMTMIATDGGLLAAPVDVTSFKFGMAERYEVVIDFSRYKVGQRVILKNLGVKNSVDEKTTADIMAFDVASEPTSLENNTVPAVLDPHNEVMALQPSQSVATRRLRLERGNGEWQINGQTWADVVESGYQKVVANPKLGDVEIWELENKSGGWFHPLHVHLVDFKVLDRNGKPPLPYENGPKDVVYLGENELIRVIMKFGPHEGKYMVHCHNLVHEDHDMMVQFQVGGSGDDPIEFDRPKDWGDTDPDF